MNLGMYDYVWPGYTEWKSYKHMSHIQGLQIYKRSSKSKHFYRVVKMARNFITLKVPVKDLQSSNLWNNQFRPSTILTTHISTTWILMWWGTQTTWHTSKCSHSSNSATMHFGHVWHNPNELTWATHQIHRCARMCHAMGMVLLNINCKFSNKTFR
jgi:hypothetical protein